MPLPKPTRLIGVAWRCGVRNVCAHIDRRRLIERRPAGAGLSRAQLVPWSGPFDDPIVLPKGRKLVTLKDAGA